MPYRALQESSELHRREHAERQMAMSLATTCEHREKSWSNPFVYYMSVVTPAGKILTVSSHNTAAVPDLVKQAEQSVLALAHASNKVARDRWVRAAHVARNVQNLTTTRRAPGGIATAADPLQAFDHLFGNHLADLLVQGEAKLAEMSTDEIVDMVKAARAPFS